ncbi:MAG: DUF4445 domain-containing protein [Dehalococcoidia bacterium]|nr:DUF4445 domain-containing protein [Dehalococcoidia bacterium]
MTERAVSDTANQQDTLHIEFEPVGRRGRCPRGMTLLQCAQQLGVSLSAVCNGNGTCGRCRVVLSSGTLSPATSSEHLQLTDKQLTDGIRLACQAIPETDCIIHIPPESLTTIQRTQVEGLQAIQRDDPPVVTHKVPVIAPSLSDVEGDVDRVTRTLAKLHGVACETADLEVIRATPSMLRENDWTVSASTRGKELIAVGPWPSNTLGLAVDLGTTKIAAYLLDMATGETLGMLGAMNPQIRFGEDVVTRMAHALTSPSGAEDLSSAAIGALNDMVTQLTQESGTDPARIVEAVVVGNTAMHHLLAGLPVAQLSRAPYVPAFRESMDIKARELGLHIAPGAYAHLLPNIAGFVGGDHVAMLLATQVANATAPVLAIDIGTNTEVCLAAHGHLTSASCASGPAFEGGHIRDGMRAAPGAIEHIDIEDGKVLLQVIDDAEPVGLCGSGILDGLATLLRHGIVDRMGRFNKNAPGVQIIDGKPEFVLVPSEQRNGKPALGLTQQDVRQLQLAKAAIETGIQALLAHASLAQDELSSVIVAGAFGTYIDLTSAIAIGMVPSLPLERFSQVGNAAGTGAKMALSSISMRNEARSIARATGYVELATSPDFMKRFVESTYLEPFPQNGG